MPYASFWFWILSTCEKSVFYLFKKIYFHFFFSINFHCFYEPIKQRSRQSCWWSYRCLRCCNNKCRWGIQQYNWCFSSACSWQFHVFSSRISCAKIRWPPAPPSVKEKWDYCRVSISWSEPWLLFEKNRGRGYNIETRWRNICPNWCRVGITFFERMLFPLAFFGFFNPLNVWNISKSFIFYLCIYFNFHKNLVIWRLFVSFFVLL